MTNVTNSDDTIDVRDVIERVEHLEALRAPGPVDLDTDDNERSQDDLFAELASLEALLDELRGNGGNHEWRGDWYPVTLIRDSYFTEAMIELVQDIGDLPSNIPGYLAIDWEVTADNLRVDYSSCDFDGATYWYR